MPRTTPPTQDLRVVSTTRLPTPEEVQRDLPASPEMIQLVESSRRTICDIINGRDPRLLMVIGPCSTHNPTAAIRYAMRLAKEAKRFEDRLLVVIRLCGEKPRTKGGWKGFLYDPHMNGTNDMGMAILAYRTMLLEVLRLGLPIACEALNPTLPPFFADLITLAWIGARTAESQPTREMASGLSMPVGFKHAGNGDIATAMNAMTAARLQHTFGGIDHQGHAAIINTAGNLDTMLILRGSNNGPNYDPDSVAAATKALREGGLNPRLMVDCSHGNASGDHRNQGKAFRNIIDRMADGERDVCALMLESYIEEGSQPFPKNPSEANPNLSLTDACIGLGETIALLEYAHSRLAA